MGAGGCRCGAVRYAIAGEAERHGLCHCRDCQMASGAPMVAWLAVGTDQFRVTQGEASCFTGESGSQRYFCGQCGTPLYFVNETMLPGIVDVQSVTLDHPDATRPTMHIQVAERRAWMDGAEKLPSFERWPE
ncbi:GFA family protein [Altererythrobacter buctensis]|uniref:GFA family protein n=1 Tax=Alteraurantiacibacter buctensis TaxID=1503981 RepID=A0A844YTY2_9SPHN|nr:GFA family protein [Alteraurantiacibacter buctensis]